MIVNRVWRWHFGQGLVRSVDNFGKLGELPSHPRAARLAGDVGSSSDGWSLKALHRRIMLSQAYQMSTAWNRASRPGRPGEPLALAHAPPRMDAEELRDSILAVSGQLDTAMGGYAARRPTPFQDLSADGRRAQGRALPVDAAERLPSRPPRRLVRRVPGVRFPRPGRAQRRSLRTTVASQALFMMNGPIVDRACDRPGARSSWTTLGSSDRDRMRAACRRILGRPARPRRLSAGRRSSSDTRRRVAGRGRARTTPPAGLAGSVPGPAVIQ